MTESSSSGQGAADPELCRVSVIGGDTQLDVGLPSAIPIAAYIGDVVGLIDSRNLDLTESEEGAPARTQHWTLARVGRDPIPPHQTLTEAEVFDGEMLVLRSVTAKESPALFDDVIDAVSRLSAVDFHGWSATSARWMGLCSGLIAVVAGLALLLLDKGTGIAGGFLALGVGAVAAGAAVIVGRRHPDQRLIVIMLGLYAIALLGTSAALATPGSLGSPHLLFGAVATLVVAAAIYAGAKAGALVTAATVVTAAVVAVAALIRMVWDVDIYKIAAGVLVVGLVLITMAPRLAVAAAKLPVPPVPTAGGAIDPADHEPRPTIEDIGAIGATALPSAAGLEQRAHAANQFQSGLQLAAAVLSAGGVLLAANLFASDRWQGQVLVAVVAIVLCLRGRAYADLVQAAILIAAGTFTGAALIVGLALTQDNSRSFWAGMILLLGAGAVVFGVLGPHAKASPVTHRMIELFEYALIILIVPLTLWVMDVYSTARNLNINL